MAVDRTYMLKKPPAPSAPKQFLDQLVVPLAVNMAGALEVALYRASDRTGIRPAALMAGLVTGVSVLLMSRWRNQRFPR